MNNRVLLGMSGGVDSSVAAILLKEEGYEVVGVTMKLFEHNLNGSCGNSEVMDDAKRVCNFLNIEHHIIDFSADFKKYVIDNFICEYKNSRTPNPCIECNKYMKFGAMWELAKNLDCEYIATGHYAKTEFHERYGKYVLRMSNAGKKDQSYVLYNLPKDMVDKVKFPLANFDNKEEIRNIAIKYNLPVANKPDSEDICFIPDGDYKKFLEDNSDLKNNPGDIVDSKGNVLGKHEGLHGYTIGQRRGLGIAYKVPLFVLGFNVMKNEVVVGEEEELYTKEFKVKDFNLILVDDVTEYIDVDIKIRYSAKVAKGKIIRNGDVIDVIFDEPQKAVTPGQSAVFYVDDVVLGGGKIV